MMTSLNQKMLSDKTEITLAVNKLMRENLIG